MNEEGLLFDTLTLLSSDWLPVDGPKLSSCHQQQSSNRTLNYQYLFFILSKLQQHYICVSASSKNSTVLLTLKVLAAHNLSVLTTLNRKFPCISLSSPPVSTKPWS